VWNSSGHSGVITSAASREPGPTASAFVAKSAGHAARQWDATAPLYRDDVVEAILHVGARSRNANGTFEFAGPDTMTAEEFALVNPGRSGYAAHRDAGPALGRAVPLTPDLVDVMLRHGSTEDVTATARLFGVELHRPLTCGAPSRDTM
jgi:hypothetical protein